MTRRLELLEDSAGSLYFDHTEVGAASSPTITLKKPDGTTLQASTAAVADTCSTTLAGVAAVGASTLSVASATGIVRGRSYVVLNAGGQWEEVRVSALVSTTVTLYEPLEFAYASSDAFVGRRITYAPTSTHTVDRGRGFRAEWSYTVAGSVYKARTLFDVSRQRWPDVLVTPQEFKSIAGDLGDDIMQTIEGQGDDFAVSIDAAGEDVRTRIRLAEFEPDLFLDWHPFKVPVVMRVILAWAESGWTPRDWDDGNRAYIERREQVYMRAMEAALDTNDSYDANDSDAVDSVEESAPLGAIEFQL